MTWSWEEVSTAFTYSAILTGTHPGPSYHEAIIGKLDSPQSIEIYKYVKEFPPKKKLTSAGEDVEKL